MGSAGLCWVRSTTAAHPHAPGSVAPLLGVGDGAHSSASLNPGPEHLPASSVGHPCC